MNGLKTYLGVAVAYFFLSGNFREISNRRFINRDDLPQLDGGQTGSSIPVSTGVDTFNANGELLYSVPGGSFPADELYAMGYNIPTRERFPLLYDFYHNAFSNSIDGGTLNIETGVFTANTLSSVAEFESHTHNLPGGQQFKWNDWVNLETWSALFHQEIEFGGDPGEPFGTDTIVNGLLSTFSFGLLP